MCDCDEVNIWFLNNKSDSVGYYDEYQCTNVPRVGETVELFYDQEGDNSYLGLVTAVHWHFDLEPRPYATVILKEIKAEYV